MIHSSLERCHSELHVWSLTPLQHRDDIAPRKLLNLRSDEQIRLVEERASRCIDILDRRVKRNASIPKASIPSLRERGQKGKVNCVC